MQEVTGKSMNVTSRILKFTIIEYKQEAKGSTLAISQDINEFGANTLRKKVIILKSSPI